MTIPAGKRERVDECDNEVKRRRIEEAVHYTSQVTDEQVIDRLSTISSLGEFTIEYEAELSDRVLEILQTKAAQLRVLKLESVSSFSEAALMALFKECHELRTLSLGGFAQEVTDKVIEILAQNRQLCELNIGDCTQVTDQGMSQILPACLKLRSLDIRYCRELTKATFELLKKISTLKELYINWHEQLSDEIIENTLGNASFSLEVLDLSLCEKITDVGIARIAERHPELKALHLSGSNCKRTDISLKALATNCLRLETLNLASWSSISNDGLKTLLSKCKIKTLNLGNCSFVDDETLEILKRHGTVLNNLKFSFGQKISKQALSRLMECRGSIGLRALEFLSFYYVKNLDKASLQAVIKCGNLKRIDVAGMDLSYMTEIECPEGLDLAFAYVED